MCVNPGVLHQRRLVVLQVSVSDTSRSLFYKSTHDRPRDAVCSFWPRRDVIVVDPTGELRRHDTWQWTHGNLLIWALLHLVIHPTQVLCTLTGCMARVSGVIFGETACPHRPPGCPGRTSKKAFSPSRSCIWPVHTGDPCIQAGLMIKGPIIIRCVIIYYAVCLYFTCPHYYT